MPGREKTILSESTAKNVPPQSASPNRVEPGPDDGDTVFRDLTARVRSLEETKRLIKFSRDKLQTAFDSLNDPVYTITPGGLVESVNRGAAKKAGRHPRDLAGLTSAELLSSMGLNLPPDQAGSGIFEKFNDGLGSRRELVPVPGQDGERYFEITQTPVYSDEGELRLGLVHLRDVTESKRMEQTIREHSENLEHLVSQRTAELADALQNLKRLDQLRRDLTNMVVHDMKGPLAELMGNLDMLAYEPLSDSQRETLDMACMGAEDLERMIRNLLDIGRLEEGRLQTRPEEVAFAPLAEKLLGRFATMIRLKDLNVRVEDECGLSFEADRDLIYRVLQNLLTNALYHTDLGGITLSCREQGADSVVLSVADTGSGIPEKYHSTIFQKFTQAGNRDEPKTSTGLGLTFCKMAVEAHGGEIWFESQENQGTVFHVRLPRKQAVRG